MPELPEVEAARRAIEEHCAGKKVRRCAIADDSKVIDGVSPSDLESALVGKTIVAALRKGKNLWIRLDSPPFPSFQFGMTGAVYIKGVAVTKYKRSAVSEKDEWPSKFSKVFIELEDGIELSFTDKRRFAKVRLLQDPEGMPPISELGPDALLEPLQVDELVDALSKKKIAMKAILLDQSFVSGIGNWIADEVLYQARIHPLRIASSLSREDCVSLHRCIKEVIGKAVEVGADSSQYPINWIFHSREKKPGKAIVDGKLIEFIAAGGRTSAFVPELQKLTAVQSVQVKSGRSSKAKPVKAKSGRFRKGKPDDEEADEGEEKQEGVKKTQPKKDKIPKVGRRRQQKKVDEEGLKKEKQASTAGKMAGKVVEDVSAGGKANKEKEKPVNEGAKTEVKEALKKRSGAKESTRQKKKARK